jgi:SPX domain protein involved in polyphosphate accumulation
MFNVRLNACPFYKETYEPIIVQLSRLYHIVHMGLQSEQEGSSVLSVTPSRMLSTSWKPPPTIPTQRFSRQSHKFWVHPNNVMEVRTTILRHLPVLIYKDYNGNSDSSISSIYFDSPSFALYQDKVDRKGGEQLLRLRWYGSKKIKEIFVERKVRVEDGEEIKDRFTIKEKHVNGFIKGDYSFENRIRKMRAMPGKTEAEIKQFEQLVSDVQSVIREKNLVPGG